MKEKDLNPIDRRLRRYAAAHGITKAAVALSGGADSVTAALALKGAGIETTALHCNFHLRGEESDRDMKFVEDFCRTHDIALKIKEFDVKSHLSKTKGTSIEMACRDLRYSWFWKELKGGDFQRIVTGHNADDNIETFFLNLLRGSGTRGLKGMEEDNGRTWRPLLRFHRRDILAYLKEKGETYVTDSTNLEDDFRRNFLRNRVLPLMKEEWKGLEAAMDKSLANLTAENMIVEDAIRQVLPEEGSPLDVAVVLDFPAPLLLIKRFVDPLKPYVTTPEEILSAIKANKPQVRTWKLRRGIITLRNKKLSKHLPYSLMESPEEGRST